MKYDYAKIGKALVAISQNAESIHLVTASNGWIVQEEAGSDNRPTIGGNLELAICQHAADCGYIYIAEDETI